MTDAGRFSMQRLMVVVQVAVSLVLLVAAVMFGRSFRNLSTFDPGMRVDGMAILFIGYPALNGPPERLIEIQRQMLDGIRAVPGVVNAAATSNTLLMGGSWSHGVEIEGVKFSSKFTWVSPGYFDTVGIPIIDGRALSDLDTRASARVAVVNRAFVRAMRAAGSPLGRTMRTGAEPNYPSTVYEIVGVIPDTQYSDLKSPTPPMVFAPQTQYPPHGPWSTVMLHASSDPAAVARTVKQTFAKTYPEAAVESMVLKDRIRDGMRRERVLAALAGFLGVLAAVLAMVGLYGMVSYAVAQRRHEIGIRVALGAGRHDVVGMMMREASRLVLAGILIGTGLALVAGPVAATLLFGLQPRDPITLSASAALMLLVAAAASFLPAHRAARLDPLPAIRDE